MDVIDCTVRPGNVTDVDTSYCGGSESPCWCQDAVPVNGEDYPIWDQERAFFQALSLRLMLEKQREDKSSAVFDNTSSKKKRIVRRHRVCSETASSSVTRRKRSIASSWESAHGCSGTARKKSRCTEKRSFITPQPQDHMYCATNAAIRETNCASRLESTDYVQPGISVLRSAGRCNGGLIPTNNPRLRNLIEGPFHTQRTSIMLEDFPRDEVRVEERSEISTLQSISLTVSPCTNGVVPTKNSRLTDLIHRLLAAGYQPADAEKSNSKISDITISNYP